MLIRSVCFISDVPKRGGTNFLKSKIEAEKKKLKKTAKVSKVTKKVTKTSTPVEAGHGMNKRGRAKSPVKETPTSKEKVKVMDNADADAIMEDEIRSNEPMDTSDDGSSAPVKEKKPQLPLKKKAEEPSEKPKGRRRTIKLYDPTEDNENMQKPKGRKKVQPTTKSKTEENKESADSELNSEIESQFENMELVESEEAADIVSNQPMETKDIVSKQTAKSKGQARAESAPTKKVVKGRTGALQSNNVSKQKATSDHKDVESGEVVIEKNKENMEKPSINTDTEETCESAGEETENTPFTEICERCEFIIRIPTEDQALDIIFEHCQHCPKMSTEDNLVGCYKCHFSSIFPHKVRTHITQTHLKKEVKSKMERLPKLKDVVVVISEKDQDNVRKQAELSKQKLEKNKDDKATLKEMCERCETAIQIPTDDQALDIIFEHCQNCQEKPEDMFACYKCSFSSMFSDDFRTHIKQTHLKKEVKPKKGDNHEPIVSDEELRRTERDALKDRLPQTNVPAGAARKHVGTAHNYRTADAIPIPLGEERPSTSRSPRTGNGQTMRHAGDWCVHCKNYIHIANPEKRMVSLIAHCEKRPHRRTSLIVCYLCPCSFNCNGDLIGHLARDHSLSITKPRDAAGKSIAKSASNSRTSASSPSPQPVQPGASRVSGGIKCDLCEFRAANTTKLSLHMSRHKYEFGFGDN